MGNVSHGSLLKAFGMRWDFQTSRTLMKYALKDSGVGEKADYSEGDLGKILQALTDMGERRVEEVNETLFGPPPAAPAEAAPAAPAEAAPPAKEEKKKKDDKKKDDKKKDDKKKDDKKKKDKK